MGGMCESKHQLPVVYIFTQEKVMRNKRRVESDAAQLLSLAASRSSATEDDDIDGNRSSLAGKMLSSRIKNPLCVVPGKGQGLIMCDKDNNTSTTTTTTQDDVATIHVTFKLPVVIHKIPPYTTWTFLTRHVHVILLINYPCISISLLFSLICMREHY